MQRGFHVDAAWIVVGGLERHVFRLQVRPDSLQKGPKRYAGPLADIVPAFDADMANDHLALRQAGNILPGPRLLILDQPAEFQPPAVAVHRLDVLDLIISVEAR